MRHFGTKIGKILKAFRTGMEVLADILTAPGAIGRLLP